MAGKKDKKKNAKKKDRTILSKKELQKLQGGMMKQGGMKWEGGTAAEDIVKKST